MQEQNAVESSFDTGQPFLAVAPCTGSFASERSTSSRRSDGTAAGRGGGGNSTGLAGAAAGIVFVVVLLLVAMVAIRLVLKSSEPNNAW